MQKRKVGKVSLKWIGRTLVALSVFFLFRKMMKLSNRDQLLDTLYSGQELAILAFLLCTISIFLLAFGWSQFFVGNRLRNLSFFLQSLINKFIPGGVAHLAARHLMLREAGEENRKIVGSHFFDLSMSLGSCLFLIAASACFIEVPFVRQTLGISSQMIGLQLIILLPIAAFLVSKYLRTFSFKAILKASPGYFAFFFLQLISYSLLFEGSFFQPVLWQSFLIAWLAGFVVIGAPGGLGVREFVLVSLLSSTFPEDKVLVLSLLHRFIFIFSQVAAFIASYPINFFFPKSFISAASEKENLHSVDTNPPSA